MRVVVCSRYARLALATTVLFAVATGLVATPRSLAATPRAGVDNISAQPWFWQTCSTRGFNSGSCVRLGVEAIENARATEGIHQALVLPDNFRSLVPAEQAFVLIDLERVDRGLRPLAGLVPELDDAARPAAIRQDDPTPALAQLQGLGVRSYRTLWASSLGPFASDYEWMYDDGYSASGDSNVDCRSPGAAGCWAHRRAILASFDSNRLLLAGAGSVSEPKGFASITMILTGGSGARPHFSYTWHQALRHGADGV